MSLLLTPTYPLAHLTDHRLRGWKLESQRSYAPHVSWRSVQGFCSEGIAEFPTFPILSTLAYTTGNDALMTQGEFCSSGSAAILIA